MAIARLTHIRISIPASVAPHGRVPADFILFVTFLCAEVWIYQCIQMS